jgi:lipoate-protein ligase A
MAVDAALMDRARETGEGVVRVYAWSRPTLTFGRNETVRGRFDAASLAARGYDAVRRPTGGRVLLHDGEVTYSVTMPATDDEPLRATYARINQLLGAAISRLGVAAGEAPRRVELRPGQGPCFAAPSAGELVVSGRKLVASAQWREGGALLQHGSILLEDRQGDLVALAGGELAPPAPAASLSAVLGRTVTWGEVATALRAQLEAESGPADTLDLGDLQQWVGAHRARFADPQWTWRR